MKGVDATHGWFAPSAVEKAHERLLERASAALGKLSAAQLHQVIAMSEKSATPGEEDSEEARLDYAYDNGVNP